MTLQEADVGRKRLETAAHRFGMTGTAAPAMAATRSRRNLAGAYLAPIPGFVLNRRVLSHSPRSVGEVPEWSIGTVSKTVVPLRVPRVRIPLSPPIPQPLLIAGVQVSSRETRKSAKIAAPEVRI